MAKVIKNITVTWNWTGDFYALKGFNVAVTPFDSNPKNGIVIQATSGNDTSSYKFNNVTLDDSITYTAWVQAIYDGADSDWLSASNITVTDDGNATLSTKVYTDNAKSSAISTASSDATTKANNAQTNAQNYTDANTMQDGISIGGVFTGSFEINKAYGGNIDAGELRVNAGKFIHPNGSEYNIDGNTYIVTMLEGLSSSDWRYIAFIGSDTTRFPYFNSYSNKMFMAVKFVNGQWKYDNNSTLVNFTPNSNDCIVAKITGQSQIDTIQMYANKNIIAGSEADTFRNNINDITNDNMLSPVEKRSLKREFDNIVKEKDDLDNQANTYNITTEKTNYDSAYTTLYNYVNPLLSNLNTSSSITGTTMRSYFTSYYDKRSILISMITSKSKSYTDDSVNNLQIGGRNLLRNTTNPQNTNFWYDVATDISVSLGVRVFIKNNTTANENFARSVRISVKPNTKYTFQMKVFLNTNIKNIDVFFLGRASGETSDYTFAHQAIATYSLLKNQYHVITGSFITGATENEGYIRIDHNGATTVGSDAYLCFTDIKLEEGGKATSYTEAPEDVDLRVYSKTGLSVRYIRDWLNGSTSNTGNHWVEIQAIRGNTNVALNKTATTNNTSTTNIGYLTDGITTSNPYFTASEGLKYVQIDLGQIYQDLDYVKVWHYYEDGRKYHNTKTEVSSDGVNWFPIFDSYIDGEYAETSSGRTYDVSYANALAYLKATQAKVTATTYADGVITAEEQARINDVNAKLNTAKSYADTKVDNIQIGGKNLLLNSTTYEGSMWYNENMNITNVYYNGSKIAWCDKDWGGFDYYYSDLKTRGLFVLGKTLTFSVYAKVDDVSKNTEIRFYADGSDKHNTILGKPTTEWKRYYITFTVTQAMIDGSYRMRFEPYPITNTGNKMYLCCYKLEEGNKPTDWSVAPEDTQSQIDSTNNVINNNKSTWDRASSINSDGTLSTNRLTGTIVDTQIASASNWNGAKNLLDTWKSGTTQINGGMIATNTIFAQQIAIGDYTNLCQINEEKNTQGYTTTIVNNLKYFKIGNGSYASIFLFKNNYIEFNVGDEYYVAWNGYKDSGLTYLGAVLRYYYTDGTWNNASSANMTPTTSDTRMSANLKITVAPTTGKTINYVGLFLEKDGTSGNGCFYIRNIEIRKRYAGELIVDGSITASKITADGITADKIVGGTLTLGGKGNVNGSLKTIDGSLKINDGNGKTVIQADKDSGGKYNIRSMDASGNVRAVLGEYASGRYGLAIYNQYGELVTSSDRPPVQNDSGIGVAGCYLSLSNITSGVGANAVIDGIGGTSYANGTFDCTNVGIYLNASSFSAGDYVLISGQSPVVPNKKIIFNARISSIVGDTAYFNGTNGILPTYVDNNLGITTHNLSMDGSNPANIFKVTNPTGTLNISSGYIVNKVGYYVKVNEQSIPITLGADIADYDGFTWCVVYIDDNGVAKYTKINTDEYKDIAFIADEPVLKLSALPNTSSVQGVVVGAILSGIPKGNNIYFPLIEYVHQIFHDPAIRKQIPFYVDGTNDLCASNTNYIQWSTIGRVFTKYENFTITIPIGSNKKSAMFHISSYNGTGNVSSGFFGITGRRNHNIDERQHFFGVSPSYSYNGDYKTVYGSTHPTLTDVSSVDGSYLCIADAYITDNSSGQVLKIVVYNKYSSSVTKDIYINAHAF